MVEGDGDPLGQGLRDGEVEGFGKAADAIRVQMQRGVMSGHEGGGGWIEGEGEVQRKDGDRYRGRGGGQVARVAQVVSGEAVSANGQHRGAEAGTA